MAFMKRHSSWYRHICLQTKASIAKNRAGHFLLQVLQVIMGKGKGCGPQGFKSMYVHVSFSKWKINQQLNWITCCYSLLTSFLLLFTLAFRVVSEDSEANATYTSPTMDWSSTAAKDFCLRPIQADRLTFPCTPKTNSYIPSTSVKARRFQALLQIFDLSSRSSGKLDQ